MSGILSAFGKVHPPSALRPPPRRKMKNPPFFREKGRRFIFRPVSALFPGKRAEISFSALRKSFLKIGPPKKNFKKCNMLQNLEDALVR